MTISDLFIFPFFDLRMVERCHSPSAAIRAGVWVSPWLSSCLEHLCVPAFKHFS